MRCKILSANDLRAKSSSIRSYRPTQALGLARPQLCHSSVCIQAGKLSAVNSLFKMRVPSYRRSYNAAMFVPALEPCSSLQPSGSPVCLLIAGGSGGQPGQSFASFETRIAAFATDAAGVPLKNDVLERLPCLTIHYTSGHSLLPRNRAVSNN